MVAAGMTLAVLGYVYPATGFVIVIEGGVTSDDLIMKVEVLDAALPNTSVAETETVAGPKGAVSSGSGSLGETTFPLKL